MNPLNDKEFLLKLDKHRHKDMYARITLLTFEEYPIEYIEGKVTGGSISVDGSSAVRRSCSLTMVKVDLDTNIFHLGLERKFNLEIGIGNRIDDKYPPIIWFPQGVYITSSLNTTRNANSYTINISGKDKMCLLNGDVGGALPSSIDFGKLETIADDGKNVTYTKLKVKDIIFNAVETYGNEMPYNIIINDLDDCGYELLEYNGTEDKPVYVYVKTTEGKDAVCENFTLDKAQRVYLKQSDGSYTQTTIGALDREGSGFVFHNLLQVDTNETEEFTNVYFTNIVENGKNPTPYKLAKITTGQTIGYRQTDVIYPEDLIANVGDSLTSILDKLKNMLGDFEYFYDLNGRFVFQKKKTYKNTQWRPKEIIDENGVRTGLFENSKTESDIFYSLEDNDLVVNFNSQPKLDNIKNDFSIWGVQKGIAAEIPIHLRVALDTIPEEYTTYLPKGEDFSNLEKKVKKKIEEQPLDPTIQWTYKKGDNGSYIIDTSTHTITCDWREIIYQMALDYHKYKDRCYDFFNQVRNNNIDSSTGISRYPTGRTQYEQYYTDIMGFWRDLFSITKEDGRSMSENSDNVHFAFFRKCLLSPGAYKRNTYYTKVDHGIGKDDLLVDRFLEYELCSEYQYDDSKIYYERVEVINKADSHWAIAVTEKPNDLKFWFDLIDTTADIGKFSVRAIGQRSKNVNDQDVSSIYYRQTPNLVFIDQSSSLKNVEHKSSAYAYVNSNTALENCFVISAQKKSAWEVLQTFLNDYTHFAETATLTTIPIFYLKPNVRVSIKDNVSKTNGEYFIDKINYSLAYNGTMSLTVTKATDEIW